jgi:hypothetical protein
MFRAQVESLPMRMTVMLIAILGVALSALPTQAHARNWSDRAGPVSASEAILKMIRPRPLQMVCADTGLSCSRDADCCPGNFCAGEDAAKRTCVKI